MQLVYNDIYKEGGVKMTNFGKRIRLLASNLGKEEQQIAKDLGLSKSQMSHYLNGNRKVPPRCSSGKREFL